MSDSTRITRWCHHCEDGIDMPNKGLGRAYVAAWATRHQAHAVTTSQEELPDDAT